MRLSRYFLPVLRETPKEAEIVSHQLMLRAGMVKQASAGIYSWLPLGYRVLKKIEQIVREEQNRAGAIEVLMPTIQSADLWRQSGRYDAYGKEMLRIKDRHDRDMLYGPTNEELITEIFRDGVKSYKDLPRNLYHIQWKFRDEVRPRFGVMRGREFLMKDAYSFDLTPEAARASPTTACSSPTCAPSRGWACKSIPMAADTGPIGGDLSHEFIILAETGESQVYLPHGPDRDAMSAGRDIDFDGDLEPIIKQWTSLYAATDEKHDAARFAAEVPDGQAGVGARHRGRPHFLSSAPSTPSRWAARCRARTASMITVQMGSYGVGVSRLVGAIIEASHDEAGIVWPVPVAPFEVGLVNLKAGDKDTDAVCGDVYEKLTKRRHRRPLRRHRRARRRQVRDHGPDRPALSDRGRPARRQIRRGRDQDPQGRRQGSAADRRRHRQAHRPRHEGA